MAEGFRWPRTAENSVSALPCNLAGSMFRSETRATRHCLEDGGWGEPDLTTCTLQIDAQPFLLVSFVLDINVIPGGDSPLAQGFSVDGTPDDATKNMLESQVLIKNC